MPDSALDMWAKLRVAAAGAPALARDTVPLPTLWFEDIKPALDTMDFVQGVLVEGGSAVVYGESNAGKTFWITDLALHVAAGMPWCDRRVEQGGVVYCALEGGVGFRNRVSAWRGFHGLEDARIPFVAIPTGLNLLDPDADTPRLIEAIKAASEHMGQPVKLVVIDTLARAFAGGNENASEDMGLLVRNMDQIRSETGACVLFVHHSGKDQAKGARGHSSLRAALDTEIEVRAEDGSDLKAATVVKQREMKKGDVFAFRLEAVVLGQNRHGEDVTTCLVQSMDAAGIAPKAARLPPDAQDALRVLNDVIAEIGEPGFPGVPPGIRSVPVQWWSDRYKARCKLGATADTKKHAFTRAASTLQKTAKISTDGSRVWLI
jgi:hypothetical protein